MADNKDSTPVYSETARYNNNEMYNRKTGSEKGVPFYRTADLFEMDTAEPGGSEPFYDTGYPGFASDTMNFRLDTIAEWGRPLSKEEIKLLFDVFGNQLDYSKISVHEGGWFFTVGGYSRTVGNHIFIYDGSIGDKVTMVHESVHVWQYQREWGSAYILDSLYAYSLYGATALIDKIFSTKYSVKYNPYNYSDKVNKNIPWDKWSAEEQAKYIEHYWCSLTPGCIPDADYLKY